MTLEDNDWGSPGKPLGEGFRARKYLIRLRNLAIHLSRFEPGSSHETDFSLAAVALWIPPYRLDAAVPAAHRSAHFRLLRSCQCHSVVFPVCSAADEPGATRFSFPRDV